LGGQFVTLGVNVVAIKYYFSWGNSHCRIKVNLNQSLYLVFLHIISLHFPFLLLSLWSIKRVFIFSTWNMGKKNTRVTSILCILCLPIHGGFTFRLEERQRWQNKWSQENEWKHIVKGWSLGSYLMALQVNSLTANKKYVINNLGPNDQSRSAQIFHH